MNLKINLPELIRIKNRGTEINNETVNILSRWKTELDNVLNNVGSETELGKATERLSLAIEKTLDTVSLRFSEVNNFISAQVTEYDSTQGEAKEYIDNLIDSLNSIATD